jgi:hypothetical protein
MPSEDGEDDYQIDITIEYESMIATIELVHILQSVDLLIYSQIVGEDVPIDRLLLEHHADYWEYPFFRYAYASKYNVSASFTCIESVSSGSILLSFILGPKAGAYLRGRFGKGMRASNLPKEMERTGKISGDLLAKILGVVNNWGEKLSNKSKESNSNIKSVKAIQRQRPKSKGK